MAGRAPLSTLLSQVLVAHTIELDNEFEQRLLRSGERPRVTSVVMWSNFLRFVGDGIAVGELPVASGLPKARVLSNVGGMERWRYVVVAPGDAEAPTEPREGRGSARALRADWIVRPTTAGRFARTTWPALFSEVERRWAGRFGGDAVEELRHALQPVVAAADVDLPQSVPILGSSDGLVAAFEPRPRSEHALPDELGVLLAQALLAYTLDFERESELSLAATADVVRVLDPETPVRDIPAAAGISKQGTSIVLTALVKSGHVEVEGRTAATKVARLTARGETAWTRATQVHAGVEAAWTARFGDGFDRLSSALERILGHPALADGLRPDPSGWRASTPYLARTNALLADPRGVLPHYPLVLHRGGWPDGS